MLLRSVVEAAHDAQIAEHGGASGVRDAGLLESAFARPLNLYGYGSTDLCALAAAYAFGIARNHPFVDADKRTAFLAAYAFLRVNGLALVVQEADATIEMLALSVGQRTEAAFADWPRKNTRVKRPYFCWIESPLFPTSISTPDL